jgi:hypothetical protein
MRPASGAKWIEPEAMINIISVTTVITEMVTYLQPYTRRPLLPETDTKHNTEKKCNETIPVEEIKERPEYYTDASR